MSCYVYSSELYHHGILGQKWGIRRFQNKDGSLTEAGKKRYSSRDLYKEIKSLGIKNAYDLREHKDSNAYKMIQDSLKNKEKLINTSKEWHDLMDRLDKLDFDNSKERENADREAYQNTYDWFKKNDPAYLKDIESKTDDLLWAHDFRKTYEGYHSEALDKAEKIFSQKHPEYGQLQKQESEKLHEYINIMKDTVNDMTGSYGNKTIKSIDDKGYRPNKVKDVVESAISDIIWEYIKNS